MHEPWQMQIEKYCICHGKRKSTISCICHGKYNFFHDFFFMKCVFAMANTNKKIRCFLVYCGTAIGGHAPEPLSFFGFLFSEHRTRGFGVLRASSRFFVYNGRQSSAPINRGWGEPRKLAPNHAKTANVRGKARSSKKNGF